MNQESIIWVNGELLSVGAAHISPLDRGFTLGDGLFETIRVRNGQVLRLEQHFARLRCGADVLDLLLLWTDKELHKAIMQTLGANHLQEAFVRLTVSRGVPNMRGLLPNKSTKPSLVIQCGSFNGYPAELYQRGMRVVISTIRRNEYSPLVNIKSLNYLDNILAKQEAASKGADDALMLNTAGKIACASAANIFFVKGNELITPQFSDGALPGTMRAHVMNELALKQGLAVVERSVSPAEIYKMDEIFLTNSLMGVMPLTSLNGKQILEGKPGHFTTLLQMVLERD